ncbi:hypothetical protein [Pseudodesulfovibrio sp.]|nr:hypothetical protein [Pseudodesulfovibrio sp.]MDD3313185.1 hypothetical protein [Pseudodesulfovibrio sp.]
METKTFRCTKPTTDGKGRMVKVGETRTVPDGPQARAMEGHPCWKFVR